MLTNHNSQKSIMKPAIKSLFPVRSIRIQMTQAPAMAFAAVLILGAENASAQLTWNSSGPTNNWSSAASNENWLPGNVVWSQNSSAVFDASSGTAEAIAVTTANTFDNITFDVSGFSITSAGAGSFILSTDLASTITVTNTPDSASIAETLANNNGLPSTLTKAGAGTLTLNGTANNTYSGGTLISAGTLIASHEGSLGQGPVTNNATLNINKANVTFSGIASSMTGNGTVNVTALGTGTNSVLLNGDYSGFNGPWNIGVGAAAGAGKVQMNGADNAATTITILPNATVFSSTGTHNAAVVLKGGDTGESLGQLRIDGSATVWAGPVTIDGVMTGGGDGIVGSNSGPATISGVISEANGPRELTKGGGGTLVLSNTNTYTGATRSFAGNINVPAINNSGIFGPLGSHGTIALGRLGTGSTLIYAGTGETTDRVIELGGANGNAGINHSGTGLLKFTSNFIAAGQGTKNLVVTNTTAGDVEISGVIPDNAAVGTTTLSANFAAAATTITLASVDGITVGANVSGTGIAAGTTITAINTGTRVVTITPATSGAGTAGQIVTVDNVVNRTGVQKDGAGLLSLTTDNTYSGNTVVNNTGILRINTNNGLGSMTGLTRIAGNLTNSGRVELSGGITIGETILIDARQGSTLNLPALSNLSGNNTVTAQVQGQTGGSSYNIESQAGLLTLSGGFTLVNGATGTRPLQLQGAGDGLVSGDIVVGTGSPQVNKQGSGTWTLTGNNNYTGPTTVFDGTLVLGGTAANTSNKIINAGTMVISGDYSAASGATTVNAGTLKLDYTTIDSGKLGDFDTLTLNGGTVELAGGTHAENVGSTTLSAGSTSLITRSSGTATMNLRTVTGSGSLILAQSGIATTDNTNTNGILPWARVLVGGVPVLAKNSTDTFDGPIVAYTGFNDITRLGVSAVPNTPAANIRIVNGGTSGNITLAAAPLTQVNFLQMSATDGPATIDPAAATDVLSVGSENGGSIWQTAGAGSLTLGTAANDGILTTGDVDTSTPAALSLLNDSTNPLVVNSTIADNTSDVVSLALGGSGPITLNGSIGSTGSIATGGSSVVTLNGDVNAPSGITNGSTGVLTVNGKVGGAATVAATGGDIVLNGANSFTGALTVGNGRTVTLTGDNSLRPAATSGLTTIAGGGTLQLQANSGNTLAGVCSALSSEQSANQPLTLSNGGFLQLRSDSSVTFTGANNFGGLGSATVNIDANQLTGAGTGNTLTIAPLGFNVNTTTINVTGGNDYTLALGTINNVTTAANAVMTLNPTTANLSIAGYTGSTAFTSTLVLGGTAGANFVTGPITNTTTATPSVISLTKNGTSAWTLLGANTYTGTTTLNDGTLAAGSAVAFNTTGPLSMAGAGLLDLNGFNAGFTNIAASAATNTITDNSAGVGTSTLAISAQANTVSALIKDGPAKALKVTLRNNNSSVTPFAVTIPNTFSGGLTLVNGSAIGVGTRLRISAPPTTVGSPGAIVSSPFGTGTITIGEANTDKAGILLDTLPNFTIANDIVFNTTLGTDQPGIRLDTAGHTFSGTITANLSNVLFGNIGTARLTGRVTGPNGLQLNASAVSITLQNATASPNDYAGDTTLGAASNLILGAANQIPDGIGKGDVVNNGTLNLAGFSETINGLSGNGAVVSWSGSPTLTVGNEDSSGIFSGTTAGTLALTKIGTGIQSLGGIGHTGDTTVSGGTLFVNGASSFADSSAIRLSTGCTLNLTTAGTDVVNALFIDGVQQASGTWGRIGSGAAHETSLITGNGLLNVTTAGGSPYSAWAAAKGLTPGVNDGPGADPDGDGATNFEEFAFDSNPLNGAASGKIVGKIGSVGGTSYMTISLPVRKGAVFTNAGGPDVSALVDGVIYRIEGSDALVSWTLDVTEVTGTDAATIQAGLPGLSDIDGDTFADWTYRTFRAPLGITAGNPQDFLRAGAE
jgi:autotransporter-associated beta strand protein